LRPGDVVAVDSSGQLTLMGSLAMLLGKSRSRVRIPEKSDTRDLFDSSGKSTTVGFRAKGEASILFPLLPAISAGVDISFHSANSWVLALVGRSITSLADVNKLRVQILDAYDRGIWRSEYVLINSVATADRMVLIASKVRNTKIALKLAGDFDPGVGAAVKITARPSIERMSSETHNRFADYRSAVACTGIRVRERWLRPPDLKSLGQAVGRSETLLVSDKSFWSDMDARPSFSN
jgi:hypothetical protein